eukprot:4369273-Pleurochrysis_carterae.AAC.3
MFPRSEFCFRTSNHIRVSIVHNASRKRRPASAPVLTQLVQSRSVACFSLGADAPPLLCLLAGAQDGADVPANVGRMSDADTGDALARGAPTVRPSPIHSLLPKCQALGERGRRLYDTGLAWLHCVAAGFLVEVGDTTRICAVWSRSSPNQLCWQSSHPLHSSGVFAGRLGCVKSAHRLPDLMRVLS